MANLVLEYYEYCQKAGYALLGTPLKNLVILMTLGLIEGPPNLPTCFGGDPLPPLILMCVF